MKKIAVLFLVVICSFVVTGCGRNSSFGVIDMAKIEKEAKQLVTIREEGTKELEKLEQELQKEVNGKSKDQAEEILKEYQARAKIVQGNMANRMRNQLDQTVHQVAQQKGLGAILMKEVVPEGGIDITADVLEKLQ